ncbi:hypothetical protein DNTS_010294 [Danionella cerebrum]|uniref:Centromere protein N n=1 Tax=Danionella cerebrum TaxID=2873325 RepID=A0A553MRB2_9TELE|nr:hypothetical protein DNTS_010294 [Danionella translucida]
MDARARSVLSRVLRRVPSRDMGALLEKWSCLPEDQLRAVDYTRPRATLTEHIIGLCEDNSLGLKHVTNLEMIYHIENPDQGSWHACQLTDPQDDAASVELVQFKEQFKAHLLGVVRHISIKIKKHEDDAIWIRIAWGDNFHKPNHLKPTYAVHHLHTSYVFISNLAAKHKIFLSQALEVATKHTSIKEGHLTTKSLTAMRDLLLRRYPQVFPSAQLRILKERNAPPLHPCIAQEHSELEQTRHQMACEAFGPGPAPKLETAVYKLETRYRGHGSQTLAEGEEFFRGVVRFSSSSLLESFHHCVASGVAEGPVTPLLSAITRKGRNYFVITDKGPVPPGQSAHRT